MAWLRLLRAGTLFSPAADVLAGHCLALGGAALFLPGMAVRGMIASVCIYAAGMVLNDVADRGEDAVQRPERPIPAGDIQVANAAVLGIALLATALTLAPLPLWYASMAVLVLGYDFILKRSPILGALTMGTLRGMNLAAGILISMWSYPASSWADATTPLASPLGNTIPIVCGVYGIYIIAVTLLGILEDSSWVKPQAVKALQSIGPIAAFLAVLHVDGGPGLATWIAGALVLLFLIRGARITEWNQGAIRGSMRWLLLGTMAYTGLLCLAAGQPWAAAAVLVALLAAKSISRKIALT